MKRLIYIHGANATPRSFRYIQDNLPEHTFLNLEYQVNVPFIENEQRFQEEIKKTFGHENISFIGHSLGGLYCVRLLNKNKNAEKAFTISSPYGGSKFVDYLSWICPSYQLFKDIRISSEVVRYFKNTTHKKPIMQIITTSGGNPLIGEPNDGTVTVQSQMSIKGVKFHEMQLNHFEVLLDDNILLLIKNFLELNVLQSNINTLYN